MSCLACQGWGLPSCVLWFDGWRTPQPSTLTGLKIKTTKNSASTARGVGGRQRDTAAGSSRRSRSSSRRRRPATISTGRGAAAVVENTVVRGHQGGHPAARRGHVPVRLGGRDEAQDAPHHPLPLLRLPGPRGGLWRHQLRADQGCVFVRVGGGVVVRMYVSGDLSHQPHNTTNHHQGRWALSTSSSPAGCQA